MMKPIRYRILLTDETGAKHWSDERSAPSLSPAREDAARMLCLKGGRIEFTDENGFYTLIRAKSIVSTQVVPIQERP